MVDDSLLNQLENYFYSGGNRDEFLEAFGIKKGTYYSWRSRGIPASRIDEVAEFFGGYTSITWGESEDLSEYLLGTITDENFLNTDPNNLPEIYTDKGHLWFQGIAHFRWIGGEQDGHEMDEVFQRTTGNNYNYPSEAVPALSALIKDVMDTKNVQKGLDEEGQYLVVCDWISTDYGEYFTADKDPFYAKGFLIWNTEYEDINPNHGRGKKFE